MSRRDRLYFGVLTAITVALLALSLPRLLPPRLLGGSDFATFRAAAWAVRHGHNPYVGSVMRTALLKTQAPRYFPLAARLFVFPLWVTFLFFWAPSVSFAAGYVIWSVSSILLVMLSFALLGRWASWPSVAGLSLLGAFAFPAFLGYDVGQVDAVLLLCETGAIVGTTYRRWLWAGVAAMVAVCLKPQVVWPLLPFLVIVAWPQLKAVACTLSGMLAVLASGITVACLLQPTWPITWVRVLVSFGRTVPGQRIDPAQVTGLLRAMPFLSAISLGTRDPITWVVAIPVLGLVAG